MSHHFSAKMFCSTNKRFLFLIYWLYNMNHCLTSGDHQLDIPHDPNHYNQYNGQYNQLSSGQMSQQISQQIPNANSQQQSSGDLRVFPFVIDPLIIIALIALPTLGMLGLSSLIMPLIPIAIYLIQLFFPIGGSGKRRKRQIHLISDSFNETNYYNREMNLFTQHLSKAFDKYINL